ncbi:zinc finger CCCH domain-containing protein 19-like isoform X2 [Telopea speciosissima]|uniref:zinc finger CCCH domain-containing protein 19-like isoform X2 n=1 Tax=Telopea speciosissima TaxID=54955 RepID=UPI001CC38794|nr:zinc finger CCCH domain-containing protein 19-like isoform X2 [Telopea speciosissima]
MEEEEDGSPGVYRPSMEVEQHSIDEKLEQDEQVEELPDTRQHCEAVGEMDDSLLLGISPVVADVAAVVVEEDMPMTEVEVDTEEAEATETSSRGGGRRKRGRQSRVQTKAPSKKKEEEDVCFICFDGGNLVLCDRRGCPKAYHPSCVNREESFFRSKGRWNCGWHICSICEKSAQFMCYTCTYSLCKACIKEAEFVCVRGNKGFCGTCLRTVMLIEKNEQGQVDFDDKTSWEYLFKDYWVDLKAKLSLTLDEVTQARNPWKGSDAMAQKEESSDDVYDANDDKGSSSDSSTRNLEVSSSKKRKPKKRPKSTKDVDSSSAAGNITEGMSIPDGTEWASKELLEFVAHMKNGDTSVLSQFDVQALLLEYIKRNNLRDPRRKSQIICDSRLENLFGKARVGHFEMLKLLEVHFLTKEDSHPDYIQEGIVDTEGSQLEADDINDAPMKAGKDKRRKTRKKGDEKESQINLDDYAAIDVHNINLIYLRRNLMEELLQDAETFHEKVVGSFVRIRISGSSQKQDMYRLVQVIGTSKVGEPYKTGKRTTNIMLEILNLDKTEKISIDTISNQEFSEDECKRLRQSIKCGFIKRMMVGQVQDKAIALQVVRVNDWLESEKLRLSHLRDRASEKGRRKELRECVEKLQLLNTPEERSRRLQEVPEVHTDPNMDPSHESDEEGENDDSRRDNYVRSRDAGFGRIGREPISPGKGGSIYNDYSWSGGRKDSTASWEPSKTVSGKGSLDRGDGSSVPVERTAEAAWTLGRDVHQPNTFAKPKTQVAMTGSDTSAWTNPAASRSGSSSGLAKESPSSPSLQLSTINDTEKMWHYLDPAGKIQGPFSMVQLRKWSTTGYFPADLRIWRTTERRDDSILLTDALNGKFHKELPLWDNSFSQSEKATVASDGRENNWDGWRGNRSSSQTEKVPNPSWKDSGSRVNGNAEYAKNDGWASRSTGWTAQATEAVNTKVQGGNSSLGWDSSKSNSSWSGQPQVHSPHPSSRMPLQQGRDGQGGDGCGSGLNHGTWIANRSSEFLSNSGYGHEKRSGNWGSSGQSSLESRKSELENSKGWSTPSSVEAPKFAREGWASDHGIRNDLSNVPIPTPTPNSAGWNGAQVSGNKLPSTPLVPSHPANAFWGPTQSPGVNMVQHSPAAVSEPVKSASGWGEQHHISVKPSLGGWGSHSDSASIPKPFETPNQSGKIDFSSPPTPTPKLSSGIWTGGQNTGNKWDAMPTVPVNQTITGLGGAPNQVDDGIREPSSSVNEPSKVAVEWSGQSPTPAKPSVGKGESDSRCSTLKQNEATNSHEATAFLQRSQVMHSSISLPASVEPSGERDSCDVSNKTSLETSVSGSNELGSVLPTKNKFVPSPSGSVPISVSSGKSLIHGPETDLPSSLHGSGSSLDLGKGNLSCPDDQQIPSVSTVTDDLQRVAQIDVLDSQKKPGTNSLEGAESDAGTVPSDFSAHVGMQKGEISNSQPDPSAPPVGMEMNTVADLVPSIGSTSKAAESGYPNLASSVSSFKPLDETGSKQKQEIVGSSTGLGLESHGWGAPSALKQEPPTSSPIPMLAAQNPGPTYGQWVGGQFSGNTAAASYGTANQAGNLPNPSSSVPELVPSGSWVQPSGTHGINWSTPSAAAPPRNPVGWDVAPGAFHGITQISSFAPVDTHKPPGSGNIFERSSSAQPSLPTNHLWGTTQENSNASWSQPQGNANMGWGGSAQGSTNTVWGAGQGTTMEGNMNMGWSTTGAPAGNPSMWASQQKHNGERFSGQGVQGGDSGRGAGSGRPWNRQSSFGGGSSRPPQKGPRVCKFHESGHCKKGAECDYLHT